MPCGGVIDHSISGARSTTKLPRSRGNLVDTGSRVGDNYTHRVRPRFCPHVRLCAMRSHRIIASAFLFASILVVTSWTRHHDPTQDLQVRTAELHAIQAENAALREHVNDVEARVELLQSDPRALLEAARNDRLILAPGEVMIRVTERE